MGSNTQNLPPADSPDLGLAEGTKAELLHVWELHHPTWGGPLTLEDYLKREEFLMTVPLAKNGGVTHWILTDRNGTPENRPIYASCETLRKRALTGRRGPDGQAIVQDGIAHCVGSVFTNPAYRGKGYASRMMSELGEKLKEWPGAAPEPKADEEKETAPTRALFSVLYSDIGKTFYANHGWAAFESSHLCFKPAPDASSPPPPSKAKKLGYHDLAMLCHEDEKILRATMERRARQLLPPGGGGGGGEKQACAALMPDLDQLLWHMMREDFITQHMFGRTPEVRGALYGAPGRRVWAVWTRGYYGNLERIDDNTFHVLRLVVEDEPEAVVGAGAGAEDAAGVVEHVAEALREIIGLARHEAREWRSFDIQMWNPSPLLRSAAARSGLEYTLVDREKSSIASLRWYGDEPTAAVDWVANEKFAWS